MRQCLWRHPMADSVGGRGKAGSSRTECSLVNGRCGSDDVEGSSSSSSSSNHHHHHRAAGTLDAVWLSRPSAKSNNCNSNNNTTNNNHVEHSSCDSPLQVPPNPLTASGPSYSTASFPSKKRVLSSRSSGLAYKKLRLDQRHYANNHHQQHHRRSESPSGSDSPLLQLLQLSISSPDLFEESPQDAPKQVSLPGSSNSVAADNTMTREVGGSDVEVVYAGRVTGACFKDKKARRPPAPRSNNVTTSSKERMTVLREDCSSSGASCEPNGGGSRPPLQKSPRCQLFPSSCHERERATLVASSPCPSNRSSSGSTLDVDLERVAGVGFSGRKRWPAISRRPQGPHSKRTSSSPAATSARHIPSRNPPQSVSRGRWRLNSETLDGEDAVSDWVSARRLLASPDPIAQVRQLEEDEEMARRLQAQFDAEASVPPIMSVGEPTTPRRARLPNSGPRRVARTFRSATQGMAPHMVGRRTSPVSRRPPQPPRWNFPHNDDWFFVEPDFMRGSPLQLLVDFFEDGGVWQDVNMDEMFDELEAESPRRRLTRGRMARGRRRRGDWFSALPWENVGDDYEALWDLTEQLGTATRQGLTRTQIGRLPTRTHSGGETGSFGTQCHICMCNYEVNEQLRILPCCHDFHAPCIDRWLQVKATCPVCRANVAQDQD